jgi:hypothetical protein
MNLTLCYAFVMYSVPVVTLHTTGYMEYKSFVYGYYFLDKRSFYVRFSFLFQKKSCIQDFELLRYHLSKKSITSFKSRLMKVKNK